VVPTVEQTVAAFPEALLIPFCPQYFHMDRQRLAQRKQMQKAPRLGRELPSEMPKRSRKKQEWLDSELREAAKVGKNAKIEMLLKAGAQIMSKESEGGSTPFHCAAFNGHFETCALFLLEYEKAGGDVKELIAEKDDSGDTSLHDAAYGGYTDICALLLSKYKEAGGGVRRLIRGKSSDGETALYKAALRGHTETCILLLSKYGEAGGNVMILLAAKNDLKWTAAMAAGSYPCPRIKTAAFLQAVPSLLGLIGNGGFAAFLPDFKACVGGAV
jgi:hypothetical protein